MKRPTILQIIPELETGGAELSTVEIAGAIVAAGGRALVLSEGGRLAPQIAGAGAEFIPFPAATKNPLRLLWNARKIRQIVAREGVDLIHARSRAPAWSAYFAANKAGVPFVTTYHGAYSEKGPMKHAYNAIMAKGAIVIANSRYTRSLIESRYGTPREKIRVIYRGVDGRRFSPSAVSDARVAALRTAWGVPPETRLIVSAARLTRWKGHSVIIEAARMLRDQGELEGTAIILAGDTQGRDGYRDRLLTEIAAAGLDRHVLLVGHVDDTPAIFKTARLAIVASLEPEAFGRTATESQVMECPVIATSIGAPPETVLAEPDVKQSERTGWLIPPDDAAAMAAAIRQALNMDSATRSAMGTRARAHVLANFSLDQMRHQTLAVYEQLLGIKFPKR